LRDVEGEIVRRKGFSIQGDSLKSARKEKKAAETGSSNEKDSSSSRGIDLSKKDYVKIERCSKRGGEDQYRRGGKKRRKRLRQSASPRAARRGAY